MCEKSCTMPRWSQPPTILLLAALLVWDITPAVADPGLSACTCSDLRDMQSRRGQAGVAVQAYTDYIRSQVVYPPYNQIDYNNIQNTKIQKALDAYCDTNYCPSIPNLPDSGANGPANTKNHCGLVVTTGTTDCLRAILTAHEEFHVATCSRVAPSFLDTVTSGTTWKDILGMKGSLLDESQSYLAEIGAIDVALQRLGNCTGAQPAPAQDGVFDSISSYFRVWAYMRGGS